MMIVNCPHCNKQLKLNEKIKKNLQQLPTGKKLKVKCIQCDELFGLDRSRLDRPGIDHGILGGNLESSAVKPPAPPSIDWVRSRDFEDRTTVEDVPRALVLFHDSPAKKTVIKAASDFGYMVEVADTAEEAVEKMRFVNYAAVFLHENYEQGGLESGRFHKYMCRLSMSRRRYILYVLVGSRFHTLYNLQALASSANIVVNDNDVEYLSILLKKTIPEYEELFGPLMEELRIAGK